MTKASRTKAQTGRAKKKAAAATKKKPATPRKRKGADATAPEGPALVVVESPAKARTLKKYLGAGYTVKASVGHVKDLPKSKLSVDLDNGFKPNYEVIRGKAKVLREIKEAAKSAPVVFLAPDPDREGEAIAWHIAEELGKRYAERTHRITFNEITKRAVTQALANPHPLDGNKIASQQARRILDRIVGYQLSPLLWDKVRMGLSAGRVQSVAVRLVVQREREIQAFDSQEYWSIECLLEGQTPPPFVAKVIQRDGSKFSPTTREEAHGAAEELKQSSFALSRIVRRERRRRPQPPLITSRLQQEAAKRHRFTAKRTMMLAQQLYEGVELGEEGAVALITYMRTDSTRVSNEALAAVREHIGSAYGDAFLPAEPNTYKSKKGAQDAHEAIRPTSMEYPPERVKPFLRPDQYKLYDLVWASFVASQMNAAVFDQTTVDISAGRYLLRASGSVLKFPGFLAAYGVGERDEGGDEEDRSEEDAGAEAKEGKLPQLDDGDRVGCKKVEPNQHFTQPPPRFSESTLVKELEDKGIGRPSTYATILSTIVTRSYVEKLEGRFHPSELGILVTDLLTESFPDVLNVAFTAHMEEQLDDVEEGKVDWVDLLGGFYHGGFKASLEKAKTEMRDIKKEEIPTDHVCAECEQPMIIKWGRNGSFLACKGYPKCRNTRDYKRHPDGTVEILPEPTTDMRCPDCQGPMVIKRGRFGQFQACQAYPECTGTRPMSIGMDCPERCGGYVVQRRSKRGRFFYGCSEYPKCTFAVWQRPLPGPCPLCGSSYLVRKGTQQDNVLLRCPNKECGYERDPELDDDDARRVAASE